MHRDDLLALIERYRTRYPQEDVARFASFVRRQPRCLERDCWDDGHVTGSAVVLNERGSAMLMTHHAKLGRWLQLGGHADGDGDLLAVACREASEESGLAVAPVCRDVLDLDIHAIPARAGDPAHYHYDVRFLLRAEGVDFTVTDESLALCWVAFERLRQVTDEPSILRMAAKCSGLTAQDGRGEGTRSQAER